MLPSQRKRDVVIVSGGVIGAASVYYLPQTGREVIVIDQGRFGGGCSHGNCGFDCPIHVLAARGDGSVVVDVEDVGGPQFAAEDTVAFRPGAVSNRPALLSRCPPLTRSFPWTPTKPVRE